LTWSATIILGEDEETHGHMGMRTSSWFPIFSKSNRRFIEGFGKSLVKYIWKICEILCGWVMLLGSSCVFLCLKKKPSNGVINEDFL